MQALCFRNRHMDEPYICKAVLKASEGQLFTTTSALSVVHWPATLQVSSHSLLSTAFSCITLKALGVDSKTQTLHLGKPEAQIGLWPANLSCSEHDWELHIAKVI